MWQSAGELKEANVAVNFNRLYFIQKGKPRSSYKLVTVLSSTETNVFRMSLNLIGGFDDGTRRVEVPAERRSAPKAPRRFA
jgi:hypothetical protein